MYDVKRIYMLMLGEGWTVTKLARKAKVPQSTLSQIFARNGGHPDNIRKIARVFGLDLSELVLDPEQKQARRSA